MSSPLTWLPIGLMAVVLLAVVAIRRLVRARPWRTDLSPAERAELAGAPMAPLQKRATWGLAIGVLTLAVLSAIIGSVGADTYYENDDLRLTVVAIFVLGLVAQAILPATLIRVGHGLDLELDERDRAIMARAPVVQSTAVILALATWTLYLMERFHSQGAVPLVYLYLIFGSIVLINMTSQSLGIVLGYRFGGRIAES